MSQDTSQYQTNYWELPSGSKIAYWHFNRKELNNCYPIIYLHRGPGAFVTKNAKDVLKKLANKGCDVYLYDQTGSGQSERLKNISEYTVDRHLSDLEAIVNIIGSEKVIFIGHSWGASLAPLYLAKHPEKVYKMIFSGPGGIIPKNFDYGISPPDSLKLKKPNNTNRVGFSRKGYKKLNKINNNALNGIKTVPDNEIDSLYDCMMRLKPDTIVEKGCGGYSNIMTGRFLWKGQDIRNDLKKLNTPVLLLIGDNDNLPWACVNDYFSVFKNCKLKIVPGSGHSVFLYKPELFINLTDEFLLKCLD